MKIMFAPATYDQDFKDTKLCIDRLAPHARAEALKTFPRDDFQKLLDYIF